MENREMLIEDGIVMKTRAREYGGGVQRAENIWVLGVED
jgi:hypothetical protein